MATVAPSTAAVSIPDAFRFDSFDEAPAKPATDWKKVLLLTGLGTLSWISTYTGMLELIQANMGEIGLIYRIAIGFAVAMLMLMIIWLLDQLFDRITVPVRVLFTMGYLFLTLISIGFGFGFYWKFLESRSEATRSAESAVTQVQSALQSAQTRLEQLQATLGQLTKISAQKAIDERVKGNSCPASRPGDGPRRRLRDADASRFGFAAQFVSARAATVKRDIAVLNSDLALIVSRDKSTFDPRTGTRNGFLKALGRKLDLSVTRFNAFRTDPQLGQFRNDFAERAGKSVFDNGRGGTFSCPDPELQGVLRGVVLAIDKLPELDKPTVAAVEGSEAIIEAFRRLTTTLSGAAKFKLPPSPDELRLAQQRAIQSLKGLKQQRALNDQAAGLGERDYIPLFIALFVDFCLLLVSVSRPMQGFAWLEHKMGRAQEGPIIKILSRFKDIHTDQQIRDVFEMFRHVVFDLRGVYYAAIPINGTDPTSTSDLDPDSAVQAQLLANLFTSFENDKIYRRVVAPFLTTRFIQKKLRTQGSKFHEAEAFRLYRFEKDQWQEWMLSAMMGAAKRVELHRCVTDKVFADQTPSLNVAESVPEPAAEPVFDEAEFEEQRELDDLVGLLVEDTLATQSFERRQAAERTDMAQDEKIHVLHAERRPGESAPRTPQAPHVMAEPQPVAINGHTAANVAPAAGPTVSAVLPVIEAPRTVSLALRARGAWRSHLEADAPGAPAAPVSTPNVPTVEVMPMPAIQIHDALPRALQTRPPVQMNAQLNGDIQVPQRPAMLHRKTVQEDIAAPAGGIGDLPQIMTVRRTETRILETAAAQPVEPSTLAFDTEDDFADEFELPLGESDINRIAAKFTAPADRKRK